MIKDDDFKSDSGETVSIKFYTAILWNGFSVNVQSTQQHRPSGPAENAAHP